MGRVKYFGILTQYAKVNEEPFLFDNISLLDLVEDLNTKYQINQLTFRVAVNEKMIDNLENYQLQPNDIVALLPPFSGG